MRSARLEMALDQGAFALPETGDVLVLRPRAGDDLSALPKDRVVVRTGFFPDHAHFAAKGLRTEGAGPFAAAVVCLPRARAAGLSLIAEAVAALPPGAPILLTGRRPTALIPPSGPAARRGWNRARRSRRRMARRSACGPRRGLPTGRRGRVTSAMASSPCPSAFRPTGRIAARPCWPPPCPRNCRPALPIWGRAGAIWPVRC